MQAARARQSEAIGFDGPVSGMVPESLVIFIPMKLIGVSNFV